MNNTQLANKARETKIEIKEYPNHYVDGTGLICYKIGEGYKYCKKAGKLHTYIKVNGKQIVVLEADIADKYVKDWRQYRKVSKDNTLTIEELHNYLYSIINMNIGLRKKILLLNEYTNKIISNA